MRRRGLALVLVVGVLGVLAVLGSAFAILSRLERRAAVQRILGTKAYLLARSGVEDATARLDAGQASIYGGENWDGDPNASLSAMEAGEQVHRVTPTGTSADLDSCPVACAMRPSFFAKPSPGNPDPALVGMDGKQRGYSGFLGNPRSGWSLKVTEPGGFSVNAGDPAVLRRMMGNLAEALDREDGGANDGSPVDLTDGTNLVDLRPSTGWTSFAQIRDLALGGSQARLDALQPYLTLQSWVDRKVIRPQGDAALVGAEPMLWADVVLGRPDPYSPPTRSVPAFEARAPVDFAWARKRRPALVALVGGLSGVFVDERLAYGYSPYDWNTVGRQVQATLVLDWALATDEARATAQRFLTTTSELSTWDQFNAFCDALPMTGTTNLRQAKRDLLKAAFNPNSDLNKFCSDVSMHRSVDKSDLVAPFYSTELDFSPGRDRNLSTVGRVLDAQGRVLSSRTLSSSLSADRRVRLTTQGEFVGGSLGALDRGADETDFRAIGASPYITPSGGPGKTFAYRSLGGSGASLQTYPEPHMVSLPAAWDGQLKLATVEADETSFGAQILFLASWTSGFDATFARGSPAQSHPLPVPPPAASLWDPIEPGILRPDGVYEEGMRPADWGLPCARTLAYQGFGNLAAQRGTISFWVKPGVALRKNGKAHSYFNNSLLRPPYGLYGPSLLFCIQYTGASSPVWYNTPSFCAENNFSEMTGDELVRSWPTAMDRGMKNRRWQLMSAYWDITRYAVHEDTMRLYMDRAQTAQERSNRYYPAMNFPPDGDFRYDNGQNGASSVFHLSGDGNLPLAFEWYMMGGVSSWGSPDATLDEFAIFDFGPAADAPIAATETLALQRFKDGRFYKESAYPDSGGLRTPLGIVSGRTAGEWFSAPLDLGESRIRTLSWTQIVPRDLRSPAGALPEDGDPGPDGRVVFEFAHKDVQVPYAGGAAYALDDAGREIGSLLRESRGDRVGRRLKAPFRLHAVFQPNLNEDAGLGPVKDDKAILDPLTLDDVTVSYRPVDQPLLSSWQEGEQP